MKGKWILPQSYSLCWCFFGVKSPHLRGLGGENPTRMGAFWGGYGVIWGTSDGFGAILGQILGPFGVALGALWADLRSYGAILGQIWVALGGGFHPITPYDPTEGALHARSLHPGHQWGRAGPHLHRPPLPYGRRGDQQVPFGGGGGPKKTPQMWDFWGATFFTPFSPFSPYFPRFSPRFLALQLLWDLG